MKNLDFSSSKNQAGERRADERLLDPMIENSQIKILMMSGAAKSRKTEGTTCFAQYQSNEDDSRSLVHCNIVLLTSHSDNGTRKRTWLILQKGLMP